MIESFTGRLIRNAGSPNAGLRVLEEPSGPTLWLVFNRGEMEELNKDLSENKKTTRYINEYLVPQDTARTLVQAARHHRMVSEPGLQISFEGEMIRIEIDVTFDLRMERVLKIDELLQLMDGSPSGADDPGSEPNKRSAKGDNRQHNNRQQPNPNKGGGRQRTADTNGTAPALVTKLNIPPITH